VTVEEYSIIRGLRNAICDTVCKRYPISAKKIGVMDTYGTSGPAKELLNKYGLDAE
jgi:transketolase